MSGGLLPGYRAGSMCSRCLMTPMGLMPLIPPMPPPNSTHPSPTALDAKSAEVLENIRGLLK